MAACRPGQLEQRVARICARAQDPLDLLSAVAAAVRAEIPYVAAGWLLTDPETLLITGVHAENVTREQHLALIECELTTEDVNKFVDLAQREVPAAASLGIATAGDLSRSVRWSKIYRPNGYGDEMRGVFGSGSVTWGHFCLTRRAEDAFFTEDEVTVMARLCPHVANGIRACLQLDGHPRQQAPAAPALLILADDGSIESMTPQVTEWLGPVEDERLETARRRLRRLRVRAARRRRTARRGRYLRRARCVRWP
jgi:hypothetical protein